MKTAGLFYFANEPQFAGTESREYLANYLRSCRKQSRYVVRRVSFGRYTVTLRHPGAPVAVIVTH